MGGIWQHCAVCARYDECIQGHAEQYICLRCVADAALVAHGILPVGKLNHQAERREAARR